MRKIPESHKAKMARKASRRDHWHAEANDPKRLAALRMRGGSIALLDHKHAREIARRKRQAGQ